MLSKTFLKTDKQDHIPTFLTTALHTVQQMLLTDVKLLFPLSQILCETLQKEAEQPLSEYQVRSGLMTVLSVC